MVVLDFRKNDNYGMLRNNGPGGPTPTNAMGGIPQLQDLNCSE